MTWFVWSQIFLGFCSVNFLWFSDTWFYGKTLFNSNIFWSLWLFSWNLVAANSFIQSHQKGFTIFVILRSPPYWQWIGMDEKERRTEAEWVQRARERQRERERKREKELDFHSWVFIFISTFQPKQHACATFHVYHIHSYRIWLLELSITIFQYTHFFALSQVSS